MLYLHFSELKTIGNGGGEIKTQEQARGREAGMKQKKSRDDEGLKVPKAVDLNCSLSLSLSLSLSFARSAFRSGL